LFQVMPILLSDFCRRERNAGITFRRLFKFSSFLAPPKKRDLLQI
jgi:hypothetical protein